MSKENPYQVVSSRTMYQNPWMRVREDAVIRPDGTDGIYGIMESEDSVVVSAVNEQNEIYLIRAYSYPAEAWSWTLPGGTSEGEDLQAAARRELAEETGIQATEWTPLGKIRIAGGIITQRTAFFLARGLSFGERPDADDKDVIEKGEFVSFQRADEMIQAGEIDDCQTITGFYLTERCLGRIAAESMPSLLRASE